MTFFLLTSFGAVFLGSIGAFFMFVPPLLILTVALLLMGFMLIFVLGIQVGSQSMLASDSVAGKPIRPARL